MLVLVHAFRLICVFPRSSTQWFGFSFTLRHRWFVHLCGARFVGAASLGINNNTFLTFNSQIITFNTREADPILSLWQLELILNIFQTPSARGWSDMKADFLSASRMTKCIVMWAHGCCCCVSACIVVWRYIQYFDYNTQIYSNGCFLDYLIYYSTSDSNAPPAQWVDVYQQKA